jgi:hypothetical protein
MSRAPVACPQCGREVRHVNHTVGEQPMALPCGHAVDYRYTSEGTVRLTSARRPGIHPVLAPSLRSC